MFVSRRPLFRLRSGFPRCVPCSVPRLVPSFPPLKADLSQEESNSQRLYGYLLVVIHCGMVVAIVFQAYVSMQVMPPFAS